MPREGERLGPLGGVTRYQSRGERGGKRQGGGMGRGGRGGRRKGALIPRWWGTEFQVTSKSATPRGRRFSLPFHLPFLSLLYFLAVPLVRSLSLSLLSRNSNILSLSLRHPRPFVPLKRPQCHRGGTVNWGKRLLVLGREEDACTLQASV